MVKTEFFDLWDIFVNELVGDVWLFVFATSAIIAFMCMKFKMPWQLIVLFVCLWWAIIFAYAEGLIILWILVLLIAGFTFYYVIAKGVKR